MGICVAMMHLAVKCTEQCFNNGLEQGLNMACSGMERAGFHFSVQARIQVLS